MDRLYYNFPIEDPRYPVWLDPIAAIGEEA